MVLGGGLLKQFACFALVFLQMVAREIGNTKIELGRGIFVVGLCSSKARLGRSKSLGPLGERKPYHARLKTCELFSAQLMNL